MLSCGNEKSLQIKQNDKFFSRLLSKESSSNSISAKAESSFRVLYYGGARGAVPFTWESQPGTPKHPSSNYSSLPPPLTPPPSFQFSPKSISNSSKSKSKSIQKPSKPVGGKTNFLLTIFPRTASKKNHFSSPSLSSSSISSSSCSSSSFSSPSTTGTNPYVHQNRCLWRSRSTVCFGVEDDDGEEEEAGGSPASTFCFGTFSSSKDLCASRSRGKMKFPL